MKIVFHSFYNQYNIGNLLFKESNAEIGDDLLSPFLSIAKVALSKECEVCTSDNINLEEVDAIVFVELPKVTDPFYLKAINSLKPLFLITLESPIVMPENYLIDNHRKFLRVFTWNDDLLSRKEEKYIKINYSFNFPSEIPIQSKNSKKLLTLISGNKKSNLVNELYSAREAFVVFMEKNYPQDFEFYGMGWDYFTFGGTLIERVLNKLKIKRKIFNQQYSSYKGSIERKNLVLKQYSFSLCYENVKDISGYITEKIFDSFFAGCVPIYLGADNIDKYIPKKCFIDRRNFLSNQELYNYIKLMSEDEYLQYLNSIKSFLEGEMSFQFTNEKFASTIIENVISNDKQVKYDYV